MQNVVNKQVTLVAENVLAVGALELHSAIDVIFNNYSRSRSHVGVLDIWGCLIQHPLAPIAGYSLTVVAHLKEYGDGKDVMVASSQMR